MGAPIPIGAVGGLWPVLCAARMSSTQGPYGAREPVSNRPAAPQRIISLIDGRWILAVLAELQHSGRRYQELDEALDGISTQGARRHAPTD